MFVVTLGRTCPSRFISLHPIIHVLLSRVICKIGREKRQLEEPFGKWFIGLLFFVFILGGSIIVCAKKKRRRRCMLHNFALQSVVILNGTPGTEELCFGSACVKEEIKMSFY